MAYNAGNPDNCANGEDLGPDQDQRGQVRVADGRCEIGAYESGIADLQIVKTANLQEIKVGENVNYNIEIQNIGPDTSLRNQVSDSLPGELELISINTNDPDLLCSFDENSLEILCEITELKSGGSIQISVEAKLVFMPAN